MALNAVASRARAESRGDAEVLRAVRGGQRPLFEVIRRRHENAALAHALTCTPSDRAAKDLVASASGCLHDRVISPVPLERGRHSGCVRLQLPESVRLAAVTRALRSPHSFRPGFSQWMGSGSMWPIPDDGECRPCLQSVTDIPPTPLYPAVADHPSNCPRRFALYEDLVDLEARAWRHPAHAGPRAAVRADRPRDRGGPPPQRRSDQP